MKSIKFLNNLGWVSKKRDEEMSKEEAIRYYKARYNRLDLMAGMVFVILVLVIILALPSVAVSLQKSCDEQVEEKSDMAASLGDAYCDSIGAGRLAYTLGIESSGKIIVYCDNETSVVPYTYGGGE